MNRLAITYFILLFSFLFTLTEVDNELSFEVNTSISQTNDFNITIDGQIVNKLGEPSVSIENLLVQYIRNGRIRGEVFTGLNGYFTINGVITGIDELNISKNKIVNTGGTVFRNTTSIEIYTNAPGEVIASDIHGKILANKKLQSPGIYRFKYDGNNTNGIHLISVQTKSWHESIKIIAIGNAGTTGFELESFKPLIIGYNLKSAEQDTLKISGENISTKYIGFWHE